MSTTAAGRPEPFSVIRVYNRTCGRVQRRGRESVTFTRVCRNVPAAQSGVQRFCHQTARPRAAAAVQLDQLTSARNCPPSPQPSRT